MHNRTELTPQEIDTIVAIARRRGGRKLAVRRVGSSVAAMALVAGLAVGTFTLVDRNSNSVAPGTQPTPVVESEQPTLPPDVEQQSDEPVSEPQGGQLPPLTWQEMNTLVTDTSLSLLPTDAKYRFGEAYLPDDIAQMQPASADLIMEDELGALRVGVQVREGLPGSTCVAPLCTEVTVEGGVVWVLDAVADGKTGQQATWQLNRDDGIEIVLSLSNRTVHEFSDGSKDEEFTREGPLPMTTADAVEFLTAPAWEAVLNAG